MITSQKLEDKVINEYIEDEEAEEIHELFLASKSSLFD
jgi:hypothetical protein